MKRRNGPQQHSVESIDSVEVLEQALSEPSPAAIKAMSRLKGDLVLLGINGKMGLTLAMMAKRASEQAEAPRRIIGVSRFGSDGQSTRQQMEAQGIETVSCDLLDREQVINLPDAENVVFMAGMKFGGSQSPATMWAMNTYMPALVCERYASSRIAVFSTGNVYGPVPIHSGGSREADQPDPVGEYAMSCLGRERIFEHYSEQRGTKTVLLRLNYAVELRYGVITDIALKIQRSQPVDLEMGYFNAIWQADANAMTLAALADADSPAYVLNIAGPERLGVRRVATQLGEWMGIEPIFTGQEGDQALLSCGRLGHERYGLPRVPIETVIQSVARWIKSGGEVWDKPTKFEVRDGRF